MEVSWSLGDTFARFLHQLFSMKLCEEIWIAVGTTDRYKNFVICCGRLFGQTSSCTKLDEKVPMCSVHLNLPNSSDPAFFFSIVDNDCLYIFQLYHIRILLEFDDIMYKLIMFCQISLKLRSVQLMWPAAEPHVQKQLRYSWILRF